jgi:hypothetical protein
VCGVHAAIFHQRCWGAVNLTHLNCVRALWVSNAILLSGCQFFGPQAIITGRADYNYVIHKTSAEQLLENILRVYNDEATLFMDVSEVDAQLTFNSSLVGGQTGIGAKSGGGMAGAVSGSSTSGNVTATLQYEEQPTIRYAPLQGMQLIQQISTPITVDSIAYLWGSDWPLISILNQVADQLTPRYMDYYAALNAIVDLDQYGAIIIAAGKSQRTTSREGATTQPNASKLPYQSFAPNLPAQTTDDTLFLFLQPNHIWTRPISGLRPEMSQKEIFSDYRKRDAPLAGCEAPPADNPPGELELLAKTNVLHLWIRLLKIYQGTQPSNVQPGLPTAGALAPRRVGIKPPPHLGLNAVAYPRNSKLEEYDATVDALIDGYRSHPGDLSKLEEQLDAQVTNKLPKTIELRTFLIDPALATSLNIINPAPFLRTRSALGVLKAATRWQPTIQPLPLTQAKDLRGEPRQDHELEYNFYVLDPSVKNQDRTTFEVASWAQKKHCLAYTTNIRLDPNSYTEMLNEDALGNLRTFMILERSSSKPSNAYVSVHENDRWYTIDNNDKVSKLDFALLAQLMTMQAIPSQTAPLTPSLSVGPR